MSNPRSYPIDAAFEVLIEMAKSGTFAGSPDKGASAVKTFSTLLERFKELAKEEKGVN